MWSEGSFHIIDNWIILKKLRLYMHILFDHFSILEDMLSIYGMVVLSNDYQSEWVDNHFPLIYVI
jgi:hypothetical protein